MSDKPDQYSEAIDCIRKATAKDGYCEKGELEELVRHMERAVIYYQIRKPKWYDTNDDSGVAGESK